jgi:hypothetical protein
MNTVEFVPMQVSVLAATRAPAMRSHGLVTLDVLLPGWVQREVLTHKRISRSFVSARAMGTMRAVSLGFYMPSVFYTQGEGMTASDVPVVDQDVARESWRRLCQAGADTADLLSSLGACKEQANRMIPDAKMMRGLLTATEDGWTKFFALRVNRGADRAMIEFATMVRDAVAGAAWRESDLHIPYDVEVDAMGWTDYSMDDRMRISGARSARMSYARPGKGKTDEALAATLMGDGHWSAFEHSAVWCPHPLPSAICSKPADVVDTEGHIVGWSNYRSRVEPA